LPFAWIAHLYTALGAVLALAATAAIFANDFRTAFLALVATTFIDATDGLLARALRVKNRLPHYDGARLDDIVDYLTYVFVPVLLIWRAGLLPDGSVLWVGGAVLLASAYGFGQADAKIVIDTPEAALRRGGAPPDHFFTGFPSYWNIVAIYMFVLRLAPMTNAAILLALAVLVFVPIRYVYPSRTATLQMPTTLLGSTWALLVLIMVWRLPATDGPWLGLSAIFPIYYTALSLWLHVRSPKT
jgi:phosphatidylcholine synthase